jgi:hypothetical protein
LKDEMQRINEEYGHIIDALQKSHYKLNKVLVGLGPSDLLYYDEGKIIIYNFFFK